MKIYIDKRFDDLITVINQSKDDTQIQVLVAKSDLQLGGL